MPTKDEIRQKLRTATISLTTDAKDIFSTVTERTMRNVVAIWLMGDGTSRTVDITLAGERTGTIFDNVPVAPADLVQIPKEGFDIENPIVVCEGGTRLQAAQNEGSGVALTCLYWDDEER
jgi:hypothetical protein